MRPDQLAGRAAVLAVAATVLVACWGLAVRPEAWLRWLVTVGMTPAIWAFVEAGQVRGSDESVGRAIMTMLRWCMAWMAMMIALQVALKLAVSTGLVTPSWLASGRRVGGVLIAVGMILFGNALPTLRSPWPLRRQPFAWQQVHRFVGWAFVLGGLGVLGSWLFLPAETAPRATLIALTVTIVLSFGRKVASLISHGGRPLAQ